MIKANIHNYETYGNFIDDFLKAVAENGDAVVIINYTEYRNMLNGLDGKQIGSNCISIDVETIDCIDEDIQTAMQNDNNMMITVFADSLLIVGEPVIYKDSFIDSVYFIEENAARNMSRYNISHFVPFVIKNYNN